MSAVVRTDKMFATDNRAGLVSVIYKPDGTPTAIENGCVVKAVSLDTGSREIYKGEKPAATDKIEDIVLIATPEVMYDERKKNLEDFVNEAGSVCRGYRLHENDIFSVTKDALVGEGSPAVGHLVELTADCKLNVVTEATGEEAATVVGTIIAVETAGRYKFYVIQVA